MVNGRQAVLTAVRRLIISGRLLCCATLCVFAGLVVVAIGLVAAAEPQAPASNWVPAGQLRESVYRPAEARQWRWRRPKVGTPSLAERLKAVRGGERWRIGRRRAAGARLGGTGRRCPTRHDGSQLPSVLVRRGSRGIGEDWTPATDADCHAGRPAEPAGAAPTLSRRIRHVARRGVRAVRHRHFVPPQLHRAVPAARRIASALGLKSQGPTISVETEGPRAIAVGKSANYRVRLVNQGTAEADHVIVTVTVPAWAQITTSEARVGSVSADDEADTGRRIVWDMERVAARSQQELSLSLQPTENRPIELAVDWVLRGAPLQASIEVQQPQLALAIEGPTEMRYGSHVHVQDQLEQPGQRPGRERGGHGRCQRHCATSRTRWARWRPGRAAAWRSS